MRELRILLFLIFFVGFNFLSAQASLQKKKKAPPKPAPYKSASSVNINVRVRFVNGQEVSGRLIDISPKSISIDPGNGIVVVSTLLEVETLSIGSNETTIIAKSKLSPDFFKNADEAYAALLSLSIATDGNIGFNEYEPKVNDVKAVVESFIAKNSTSGQNELFKSMRNSIRAFELAIPVWSLRIGAEQHKYVLQSSRQMQPIIETFPDIVNVPWKNNDRYPVEMVISWLWVQGSKLSEQSKKKIAQLKQ